MRRILLLLASGCLVAGCHTDLWVQPQTRALEPNATFPYDQSARPLRAGTIPFDAPAPTSYETGLANGEPVEVAPVAETERRLGVASLSQLLQRGQIRFNVFCSPCHGRLGDGEGMIDRRGLRLVRQPRNLQGQRIVRAPDGHIFRVITHGYGAMFPYGDRIPPADRWAIVAYIRALELSQGAHWEVPRGTP